MPRYIISFMHEGARYFSHYSEVVDAPVSEALPREEFASEYLLDYGRKSSPEMLERLERAERCGSSALPEHKHGLLETVWNNRAGPGERCLTLPGLIAQMLMQPVDPKHVMREGFPSDDDENPFEEWCRAGGIEIEKE